MSGGEGGHFSRPVACLHVPIECGVDVIHLCVSPVVCLDQIASFHLYGNGVHFARTAESH